MNVYNIQDLLNKTNTTANIQFSGPFNCPSIVFCTGASGGHWIVIEETRENYLIFDPYGTPPGRFYNIKNIPKDKPVCLVNNKRAMTWKTLLWVVLRRISYAKKVLRLAYSSCEIIPARRKRKRQ